MTRSRGAGRLVSAEILKLRKRRGLMIASIVLTIVPMVVAYSILVILHATNAEKHGPAGGLDNFEGSFDVLTVLSSVAAILIGTTAGAGDLRAGVFRELVATGRSRVTLFAVRLPGGLVLLGALVAVAFAITAVASVALAGELPPAPGSGLILRSGAWLALVTSLSFVLALGLSSLLGSRGMSIGILLGWGLAVSPVLLQIGALGSLRKGLYDAATERVRPVELRVVDEFTVSTSVGAAVLVIVLWTLAALAVGAWRTSTRDA
jgi:hypothetical protein